MQSETTAALVTSIIGGLLVALVNHIFTKQRTEAEARKLTAEAEKLNAEAEHVRVETSRIAKEASRLEESVQKATELLSGNFSDIPIDSEAALGLASDAVTAINGYLRSKHLDRCSRDELSQIVLTLVSNDVRMAEFVIDGLKCRGYLMETSPSRYEITRSARQRFLLAGGHK